MNNSILAVGFRPSFTAIVQEDESYLIYIQPSPIFSKREKQITLNSKQYEKFAAWLDGYKTLKKALPELTPEQRELFITGMDDEDYEEVDA